MRRTVLVLLLLVAGGAACGGGGAAATTVLAAISTSLPPLSGHPLGFGFHLGSADQTVGLFVNLTNYEDYFYGRVPEVTALPDPMWEAEVHFGHDLFTGSGGVVLPSDPRPVVDEVWPVVGGTITILEMPPVDRCGLARGLLQGLVAVTPDGTRVHLGDFEARNEFWGCLAQ